VEEGVWGNVFLGSRTGEIATNPLHKTSALSVSKINARIPPRPSPMLQIVYLQAKAVK